LCKKHEALEQSFDELNATHERLMETHKKLKKAHTKLEKTHSTLLSQDKKELVVTCDVGSTCDLLNESFFEPIIIGPTNSSCSSSTTTLPSDGFTCDATQMVKNETLKNEVNELISTLGNAYGGVARLLKCLGSQRISLSKEGLGYTPKKGKTVFATYKTSFVKSNNGRFCNSCKQIGHLEQYCKNKKSQANVSSIKFDSCYLLTKGTNCVKAKFIGTTIVGSKKNPFGCPGA
jgi:hypothetical protein